MTGNSESNGLQGLGGNDVLYGREGSDSLAGGTGNDIIEGGSSAMSGDIIDGGANIDTASYANAPAGVIANLIAPAGNTGEADDDIYVDIENLAGSRFADVLTGNTSINQLSGGGGNDTLNGGAGVDTLAGGAGRDTLAGGVGVDRFVFNTGLSASTNVDRITDMTTADLIQLKRSVFAAIGPTLTSGEFVKNGSGLAAQADDRIIYETDTGELYYDRNGSAAGGAVLFAVLTSRPNIGAGDFQII